MGDWGALLGRRPVDIDVLAGTSAGGMNAAFLAVAERYDVALDPLRTLWLDAGGLEPAPDDGRADDRHLLRDPSSSARSLLDGELFHERLHEAFDMLLPAAGPVPADDERKRIDLRLTTTSLQGTAYPVLDDLGSSVRERRHRASFHFVDGAAATNASEADLTFDDDVARRRLAVELLVDIAAAWTDGRPEVLDEIAAAGPTAAGVAHARTVLSAIEVVRGAFEPHEPAPEQVVRLGLLTPQRPACLDAVRRRTTTAEKLAGEELGHFGAFLKRSWRANDWLWGRLDASTFLFEVVACSGVAPTVDQQRAVQAAIVREDAPHLCAAVVADRQAGAVSPRGEELLAGADGIDRTSSWGDIVAQLDLDAADPEADFLARCRIGEEQVADERWSSLLARVGTRAAATTLGVLRGAALPFAGVVDKVLAPVRGLTAIASRYTQTVRPRRGDRRGTMWVARVATAAVGAAALLNLVGVEYGVLTPFVWSAFGALLLTYVLVAPLTTLLTIVGVALVGLAASIPSSWTDRLPASWAARLPIDRWLAAALVATALTVISWSGIDAVDKRLRRLLAGGGRRRRDPPRT